MSAIDLTGKLDQGIARVADKYAGLAGILGSLKGTVFKAAESDVAYDAGVELTLRLTAPVDLSDPMAREEHSVVLRRAALSELSVTAWRRRLGELTGVRVKHQPALSVVMATRRPELLEHAIGQVARQRGVEELELVLAPHGFEPDAGRVRQLAGDLPVQRVPPPGVRPS